MQNSFQITLGEDIKNAMRAKDSLKLNTLRALKSALANASLQKGNLNADLEQEECLAVVRKQIKQRHDAYEQYVKAARSELAEKEQQEAAILAAYLPAQLGAAEAEQLVAAVIADLGVSGKSGMSTVIKEALLRANDRLEAKTVAAIAARLLA